MEIDARVQSLVDALSGLPGVVTFSSCGGHPDPMLSQVPADAFYVNFQVESAEGWLSLERVVYAAGLFGASVTAWFNGGEEFSEGSLCFELAGSDGVDPDLLAEEIEPTGASLTLCRDCGVDAWRFEEHGRVVHEDFYVHDELWNATCPDDVPNSSAQCGFVLCIGCFERRLGRELVPGDFQSPARELFGDPPSARFVARAGRV